MLQVEDIYQEEREFDGRKINYVILSNVLDMKGIVLTDKENARKKINQTVEDKMSQKRFLNEFYLMLLLNCRSFDTVRKWTEFLNEFT